MQKRRYSRTPEQKEAHSEMLRARWRDPEFRKKFAERKKDPEVIAKRLEAQAQAYEEKSDLRKWMAATGCNVEQYYHAYVRWFRNKDNHNTAFSLEQEIARSMERPDGKVVTGHTRKVSREKIQANGQVPVLDYTPVRRKKRLPTAPDASVVPLPFDECWKDFPDDTAWVDQLD